MEALFDILAKEKGEALNNNEKLEIHKMLDIPKGTNGFYLDAFGNQVSYNGIATLKRQYVKLPLKQTHIDEIKKCSQDIFYFVNNYCKILTKSGIEFPEFRPYQQQFLELLIKGNDVAGTLSRQSGKSITCGLYLLWKSLFTPNINIGIAANKLSLAMEVLDKIKKIFIELPIWLQQGIVAWNKTYIEYENGTRIMTAACNGNAFRGYSCHLLLLDEVAFIGSDMFQEISDSLFPSQDALAQKQKILISTPNGMNHWYHIIEGARKGINGYEYFSNDWREVPRYNKDGSVMDTEVFKQEIIKKNGQQFFAQNYALEFLGSSKTLISPYALKTLIPLEDSKILYNSLFDKLRIFEEVKKNHSYVIGVDPKKEGVDKLAIQVLDVTNLPFKQVASYNYNLSYLSAPAKIFDLANYYNTAYVVIENNIDNSIVDTLYYQYDYEGEIYKDENKKILGFRTTIKTKKVLLSLLKKLIEEGKLIINDKETISEFFTFEEKKNGTFSAAEGLHDDLVMALMIALAPFINIKHFEDFKGFLEFLESQNLEKEKEEEEFSKFFVGMSFSTEITDENLKEVKKDYSDFIREY